MCQELRCTTLNIHRSDRFVLTYDDGKKTETFPYVEPEHPGDGVARFDSHSAAGEIRIDIRYTACRDAMSGQAYPDTVTVQFDDRTLQGCGRPL